MPKNTKSMQVTHALKSMLATGAKLRVEGKWMPAKILDKDGNLMPFPCEVKTGETYIIEVEK